MTVQRILLRRDTAANWTAANPVLALGEEGVETDTLRRKLGDGVTAWTGLAYSGRPPADLDGDITALVAPGGSKTAAALAADPALKAAYGRGVSVTAYGAVGGDPVKDTAAFQAAFNANLGAVFLPEPPSGQPYQIVSTISMSQYFLNAAPGTSKALIGLGNGLVLINYSGSGYCFEAVSTSPGDATQAITDFLLSGVKIDGGLNTVSDGALHIDGGYSINFDRFEARNFSKPGAIAINLLNCFSIDFSRSNALVTANGTGLRIGGSSQQVTNVHMHEFLLQRNAINLQIDTGITGGGMQVDNGAIRANDSSTAVQFTGKFADVRFGPALHIESETAVATNTTTGFAFSGSSLFASQIKFEGVDFYNIKTLFDLDGSAGTLRDVTIDHIYATGLPGLAGAAFKLNTISTGFKLGRYNVSSAQYATLFALSGGTTIAEPIFIPAAQFAAGGIGTPALSTANRWPVWLLDSATSEVVAATTTLPTDWNNVAIDAVWTNAGTGAGAVDLRVDTLFRTTAGTLAAPSTGPVVTTTAGAQNVVMTSTLVASTPVTSTNMLVLNIVRTGADAADTLPNDVGLLGVTLRRVG